MATVLGLRSQPNPAAPAHQTGFISYLKGVQEAVAAAKAEADAQAAAAANDAMHSLFYSGTEQDYGAVDPAILADCTAALAAAAATNNGVIPPDLLAALSANLAQEAASAAPAPLSRKARRAAMQQGEQQQVGTASAYKDRCSLIAAAIRRAAADAKPQAACRRPVSQRLRREQAAREPAPQSVVESSAHHSQDEAEGSHDDVLETDETSDDDDDWLSDSDCIVLDDDDDDGDDSDGFDDDDDDSDFEPRRRAPRRSTRVASARARSSMRQSKLQAWEPRWQRPNKKRRGVGSRRTAVSQDLHSAASDSECELAVASPATLTRLARQPFLAPLPAAKKASAHVSAVKSTAQRCGKRRLRSKDQDSSDDDDDDEDHTASGRRHAAEPGTTAAKAIKSASLIKNDQTDQREQLPPATTLSTNDSTTPAKTEAASKMNLSEPAIAAALKQVQAAGLAGASGGSFSLENFDPSDLELLSSVSDMDLATLLGTDGPAGAAPTGAVTPLRRSSLLAVAALLNDSPASGPAGAAGGASLHSPVSAVASPAFSQLSPHLGSALGGPLAPLLLNSPSLTEGRGAGLQGVGAAQPAAPASTAAATNLFSVAVDEPAENAPCTPKHALSTAQQQSWHNAFSTGPKTNTPRRALGPATNRASSPLYGSAVVAGGGAENAAVPPAPVTFHRAYIEE